MQGFSDYSILGYWGYQVDGSFTLAPLPYDTILLPRFLSEWFSGESYGYVLSRYLGILYLFGYCWLIGDVSVQVA